MIFCFAVLLLFSNDLFAINVVKHDVPDGYSLKELNDINGSVLIPDGWYFLRESKPGTIAYFITKEEIKNGGIFTTGLTINIHMDAYRRISTAVEGLAMSDIKICADKFNITRVWNFLSGPLLGYGCSYNINPEKGLYLKADHLSMASSKTGALYRVTFESPQADWQALSQIRGYLLNRLVFDGQAICSDGNTNNKYFQGCQNNNNDWFNKKPSRLYGSQPLNEISEYFETKSTGVAYDFDDKSSQYSLTLKVLKNIPRSAYLVINFDNPLDKNNPVVIEKRWQSGKEENSYLSPKIKGMDCGYYWAIVSLYRDRSKDGLLGRHHQLIQSRASMVYATKPEDILRSKCM